MIIDGKPLNVMKQSKERKILTLHNLLTVIIGIITLAVIGIAIKSIIDYNAIPLIINTFKEAPFTSILVVSFVLVIMIGNIYNIYEKAHSIKSKSDNAEDPSDQKQPFDWDEFYEDFKKHHDSDFLDDYIMVNK